jgi:hypothetical protein
LKFFSAEPKTQAEKAYGTACIPARNRIDETSMNFPEPLLTTDRNGVKNKTSAAAHERRPEKGRRHCE